MRNFYKAAIVAFGVTGALAAAPAGAQPYDPRYDQGQGYGPDGGQGYGPDNGQGYGPDNGQGYGPEYGQGYGPDDGYSQQVSCDPYYGCPEDYYDLPLYYGNVYYDGGWSNGPFFYRDYGGGRQFWIHGGWHGGNVRGGRFGPALGRDYFARHNGGGGGFNRGGFNRGGNFGGQGYGRGAPQQNYQSQSFGGNHNWNRGSFGGGGWNRQGVQSFQSRNVQPQTFQGSGGGWRGRGGFQGAQPQSVQSFQGNRGGWGGRSFQGQQAAPQQNAGPRNTSGGFRGGDGGGFHRGEGGGGGHHGH